MSRILAVCLGLLLFAAVIAAAEDVKTETQQEGTQAEQEENQAEQEDNQAEQDAKEMSGMSIVGNDEAPKSLYIVPWKSSEIGVETSLNTLLNEGDVPVDRDVFERQLEFYHISTAQ